MTRSEFMEIKNERGFFHAIDELSGDVYEIATADTLEQYAKEQIDRGYYGDAIDVCYALNEHDATHYRMDFCGEPTPIESIEDIEDLFEEE